MTITYCFDVIITIYFRNIQKIPQDGKRHQQLAFRRISWITLNDDVRDDKVMSRNREMDSKTDLAFSVQEHFKKSKVYL